MFFPSCRPYFIGNQLHFIFIFLITMQDMQPCVYVFLGGWLRIAGNIIYNLTKQVNRVVFCTLCYLMLFIFMKPTHFSLRVHKLVNKQIFLFILVIFNCIFLSLCIFFSLRNILNKCRM